jgi:spermidine synthase
MNGLATRNRFLPYLLAFFGSLCIMILELVASRLVARHVGASLNVWTSVIGIMLGGICLGNVLGGRLADRCEPSRVIGPLYALGAALTLASLWLNSIGGYIPEEGVPNWFRTVILVSIDFLIPGTVLGMIGPVVAKIAVEQARKAGSAIGDVYFLGAVGSIAGTFLAGFVLMRYIPTTTIVTLVAAGLAFMSAFLLGGRIGLIFGLFTTTLLCLGSIPSLNRLVPIPGVLLGGITIKPIALAGHVSALALAVVGLVRLIQSRLPDEPVADDLVMGELPPRPKLNDLAALAFLISLAFMSFEMAAGRLVSRHLGSSIYGWTSIIGVLLGGLSLGNLLGGKMADSIKSEKQASWLFLAASALLLSVLLLESPPRWLVTNPIAYFFQGQPRVPLVPGSNSILSAAISMTTFGIGSWQVPVSWGYRLFIVITMAFFLPSVALGTVSPVMAKLAIDRVQRTKRTGAAIGVVYAWGMVGSILGTFLTGFLLIDVLGTKGVIVLMATLMALAATVIGTTWHAVWAGIPLGLCIICFVPIPMLRKQADLWGIREMAGDPNTDVDNSIAWLDESNYYYIKVENEIDDEGKKRTLVLDNLIHGYFILDHPERLDYDYEHIYALVSDRVARAKAKKEDPKATKPASVKTMFLGGGAYTFQRYMLNKYPGSDAEVAEIDPAVKEANHQALGLPRDTPIVTHLGDARQFVERNQTKKQFDIIYGDAFNDFSVPWHLTTKEFNDKLAKMLTPDGVYMINIIDVYESKQRAEDKAKSDHKKAEADFQRKAVAAFLKKKGVKDSKDEVELTAEEQKSAEDEYLKNGGVRPRSLESYQKAEMAVALNYGGFLGAWVKTARETFPYVYVFGTDNEPGSGLRETFVVVVSKTALDLDDLGGRETDPKFFAKDQLVEPKAYTKDHMNEVEVRSKGIILTDDFAPVENLLAPVAATRGDD